MPAVALFFALSTQWRITSGMRNTYTGLDYTAVHATLQMQGIPAEKWPDLFDDIRVIERAALAEMRAIEQQRSNHVK